MKPFLVFLLLLCGMTEGQIKEYKYMNQSLTWSSAQTYCRETYSDLATITTDEEYQKIKANLVRLNVSNLWIGMRRAGPKLDIWQWSDGETDQFFKWMTGQPDNYGGIEDCVSVSVSGWNDARCKTSYKFICYVRVVLVKENKTWEEALDYCRIHYTGLVTPITAEQITLTKNTTSQTVSVWTGLHFVNGQWICVNKQPLGSLFSLPPCPAPRYRCGAQNTKTKGWENRDCNEKLNFLCY